jgi:SAM-dependent methyltransferase
MICSRCDQRYPMVGTVPCLVPDPPYWESLWRSRLDDYLDVTDNRIRFMQREASFDDILPRTRARLHRLIEAKSTERIRIQEIFAGLALDPRPKPHATIPSRPEPLGGRLKVLEWYEHVFRDWAWGEPESSRYAALVARLVGRKLDFLAVYGAGAGRLAFDVHRSLSPNYTLALDLNPLPLLIAERLVRGAPLELDEFPVSPTTDRNMVVRQRLSAPAEADERFRFAFADALAPPLRPGTVDAVLTPWFVDAIPIDLRESLAAINRALRPGGLWIQIGPLNFDTVLSKTYLIEEVLELTERAGFRVLSHFQERVSYFDSPFSGSWREETVYCLAAEKEKEAGAFERRPTVAPWVGNPALPIPVSDELISMARTTAFTTMVMSLIDGTRSISDIATAMAERLGMDNDDLKEQLRAFFGKLPLLK